MTLNPIKWWQERKQAENEARAREGKTTSGYLSAGARAGYFRNRKKI